LKTGKRRGKNPHTVVKETGRHITSVNGARCPLEIKKTLQKEGR